MAVGCGREDSGWSVTAGLTLAGPHIGCAEKGAGPVPARDVSARAFVLSQSNSPRAMRHYMFPQPVSVVMSANKKVIESYFAGTDRSKVASLLADDIEWVEWADGVPPSGVITRGKTAYIQNFGTDELRAEISRMTEEGNVVVAEGTVHVHKKEGRDLAVQFVDIFELEHGKIKRKSSFGALLKEPE
jgi:uncharacterized protein